MKLKLLIFIFQVLLPGNISGSWFSPKKEPNKPFSCEPDEFPCGDQRGCVPKHRWCDDRENVCNDRSDRNYCNSHSDCIDYNYFKCDNGGCIPPEGECDGYPSCKDGSDELGCQCEDISEDISDFKSVNYKVYIAKKSSKCWKIMVSSTQYINMKIIQFNLQGSECNDAYLMIDGEKSTSGAITLCPQTPSDPLQILERFDTTVIRYHGSQRHLNPYDAKLHSDSFYISIIVADLLCKKPESFKCTEWECIVPAKRCDGIKDCSNGKDEQGCERGVMAVPHVSITLDKGLSWLKKQRNAAWGWRDNTHRAVVAMYLAHGANFNGSNQMEDLTAKQLELQMTTAILRNETDPISPTQLAMYINALLVICHEPNNFYGFNLVRILRDQMEASNNAPQPLPYLALCNAGETLTNAAVERLLNILKSSSDHSFLIDVQAVAVMALACVSSKSNYSSLEANINETTNRFKKEQNVNGSFGNIYTTALVIQALLSSGCEEDKDWDLKAAIEYLQQTQNKINGSFGDLLATSLILPILNAKSLVDIGNINCTENLKMPRDGNPVSDIELRLGQKMSIKYCLYIGNEKDQIHPINLRTPSNITVLDIMRLASEADPKYRFEAQTSKGKLYIYKLSGISNDPEDGKFWLLYTKSKNETLKITSKSPNEISVNDKDDIIMWYRSAAIE